MQVTCIPVYVEFLVEYCSEVLACTLNRILGSSKDDGRLIMKKVCLQVGAVKLVKQACSCLWTNRHQPVPLLRLECHCTLFKVSNNLIAKPRERNLCWSYDDCMPLCIGKQSPILFKLVDVIPTLFFDELVEV